MYACVSDHRDLEDPQESLCNCAHTHTQKRVVTLKYTSVQRKISPTPLPRASWLFINSFSMWAWKLTVKLLLLTVILCLCFVSCTHKHPWRPPTTLNYHNNCCHFLQLEAILEMHTYGVFPGLIETNDRTLGRKYLSCMSKITVLNAICPMVAIRHKYTHNWVFNAKFSMCRFIAPAISSIHSANWLL